MKKFIETALVCIMIGIGFSGLFGYWNTQGILIDEIVTASLTITDIQTGVLFLWAFLGVILGIVRK